MVYITVKASPRYRQMTLEDLLFGTEELHALISKNETGTVTYQRDFAPADFLERSARAVEGLFTKLDIWDADFATPLCLKRRGDLYSTFYIPKRSGGLRKIDAPCDELSKALRRLKDIMEEAPCETYHTSAYAYVPGRCTVDAVKRHQQNESQWFAKFDLHNFFGSTTPDFLVNMLSLVFPYSELVKVHGRDFLCHIFDLCFKDGGLPQGTPISPFLTNLMMIPIDYALSKALRDFETPTGKQTLVYTRYADDFLISSRYGFSYRAVEDVIRQTLERFGAPFWINTSKTRYGSRSGSNWNLGVMLNKDNEITVGHQKKKQLQNMLFAYAKDRMNGVKWDEHDIRVMDGLRSYCHMVEGETVDRIVAHIGGKLGADIPAMIREDLRI